LRFVFLSFAGSGVSLEFLFIAHLWRPPRKQVQIFPTDYLFYFDCLERAFGGYLVWRNLEFAASFQTLEDWIEIMSICPTALEPMPWMPSDWRKASGCGCFLVGRGSAFVR